MAAVGAGVAGASILEAGRESAEPWIRDLAEICLRKIGLQTRDFIPAMARAFLTIETVEVAEEMLSRLDSRETDAVVRILTGWLDDADRRDEALEALGELGPIAALAVPDVVALLEEECIRNDAIAVLGEIGPAAAEAIPRLRVLADDWDTDVREVAAAALGKIGVR
jgi:HEAT repeat protein